MPDGAQDVRAQPLHHGTRCSTLVSPAVHALLWPLGMRHLGCLCVFVCVCVCVCVHASAGDACV